MAGYVLKYGLLISIPTCIITVIVSIPLAKRKKVCLLDLIYRCLFVIYCCFLLSATFAGRPRVHGAMLIPFSSYYEAWVTKSFIGWRNILLNIGMFIPFGVLFPMCWDRKIGLRKFIIIVLLTSLSIEIAQYVSSTGLFEIDDLTNNLLGSLIGFSAWKLLKKKRLFAPSRGGQ